MSKLVVLCTSGDEDIHRVKVAMGFALTAKKAGATVSFIFIGRSVRTLVKDSINMTPEIKKNIEDMIKSGIEVSYCMNAMKNLALNEESIVKIDGMKKVIGGEEAAKKVDEGYTIVNF
ncbi:hypothetical protein DFR86_01730 [Acidianus sulfidivorans JP7]|uniref:Uncharacterized protein n=1 Tax=Acidianus sulfidivorans JP7 TaxID=619593 RepID=A0A2U9IK16_9CREN|nr:DsrE family protein [Acidianus sulfidivorans]AWR96392.1 hypothetical protein DFR86_01730 [Acidianus sulfidivorans JP7]